MIKSRRRLDRVTRISLGTTAPHGLEHMPWSRPFAGIMSQSCPDGRFVLSWTPRLAQQKVQDRRQTF